MSDAAITYAVGAFAGVFSLAAFGTWVLVPAWASYSRGWQRVAAAFLSLYVLAAMVGLGILAGGAVIWFWDRIG
ncbi:MAG: hypothetical protein QOD76_610 [Solirubrobacteraceae bacterium]|jgi:hypothetical protein|nr:hypothetical protein [Solirubrobacteraceae bacterium]